MENYGKKLDILDNIIHFGLDHLEIYATWKGKEDIFNNIEFIPIKFKENDINESNKGILDNFSFVKSKLNKFEYKIVFRKEGKTIFSYYKSDININSFIKAKNKLTIHSTGFKLVSYEEILYFIEYYFHNIIKTVRFDICIDVNIDINLLLTYFKDYETGLEKRLRGSVLIRYLQESNKYKNKRQLIRVYDKKAEILANKKHKLFKEYLAENFVTRFELEIRSELAKNKEYKELFSHKTMTGIFKNYFRKHTEIFNFNGVENITLYKKPELKIDSENYQSLYYKNMNENIFLGHAKTNFNLGFEPVLTLLANGLYGEKTKKILGIENINELISREHKAIQTAKDDKYFRNNINKILSNYYKYNG